MTIPTLDQLNKIDCCRSQLLLLRILNTSDFTFMYMLYDDSTQKDICKVAESLLEFGHDLSDEELKEYQQLIKDIRE